jgi:hypothetical protein
VGSDRVARQDERLQVGEDQVSREPQPVVWASLGIVVNHQGRVPGHPGAIFQQKKRPKWTASLMLTGGWLKNRKR